MNIAILLTYYLTLLQLIQRIYSDPKQKRLGGRKDKGGARRKPLLRPYEEPKNTSRAIIEHIMKDYIKDDPPRPDRPTEVKLGIYVNSFYSVNEQTMDYSVNMYLRQAWRDPRLAFKAPSPELKSLRLGDDYVLGPKSIWIPDTFFKNEKKADFHSVTVKNRLVRLSEEGDIWYVSKISATLTCPMKLQTYPMDVQVCSMSFESFGYTMNVLYFAWIESPVEIDPDIMIAQFERVDELLYDCSQNYTTGAYPCQEIQFRLRRALGYFIIQIFVPSSFTVILSWVSFWINIDGVPARVTIGLLTVLTTCTQSSGINASMPRVSYIKAIDIWMIMCLVFVFAALLEYAFVNVAARNGVRVRTPIVRQSTLHTIELDRRAQDIRTSAAKYGCWKVSQ